MLKEYQMNSTSRNINIADFFYEFLKNLKHDSKLDLISKLSESLKMSEQKEDTSLQALFGAYKSDETAEQIIADLRSSRVSNRNIEKL